MRLLFVSNLYPNVNEPTRGTFNDQQVAALAKVCTITKVIAPTSHAMANESRNGIPVVHPQFPHIPLLSRPFNGWLFARSIEKELLSTSASSVHWRNKFAVSSDSAPVVKNLLSTSPPQPSSLHPPLSFDLVLVNWAYPDAYGVMLLAKKYGFPFAITVQGSDVNVLFQNPHRKKQVLTALLASSAVFCRSNALRDTLAAEGIMATTIYNGVDRDRFHPMDRAEACAKLGLDPTRKRILYVGNLHPVKGPTVLAKAFARLCHPEHVEGSHGSVDLVFIGTGPERNKIEQISSQYSVISSQPSAELGLQSQVSGLRSRVWLLGSKPHSEIPLWMNACDVLCLPSFNEGLPNIAIEAAACGRPVVASKVGGVPEIVQDNITGFLVPIGNPDLLASALRSALERNWDRNAITDSASQFDWTANAKCVCTQLQQSIKGQV